MTLLAGGFFLTTRIQTHDLFYFLMNLNLTKHHQQKKLREHRETYIQYIEIENTIQYIEIKKASLLFA